MSHNLRPLTTRGTDTRKTLDASSRIACLSTFSNPALTAYFNFAKVRPGRDGLKSFSALPRDFISTAIPSIAQARKSRRDPRLVDLLFSVRRPSRVGAGQGKGREGRGLGRYICWTSYLPLPTVLPYRQLTLPTTPGREREEGRGEG